MQESHSSISRIQALDGIRAIAIILVFFRHSVKPFWENMPELFTIGSYNVLTFFYNGWIGVDLFFVLSGFLITLTFIKHKASGKPVLLYLYKRILRIVPAYYAVLFVCVLGIYFGFLDENKDNLIWRTFYHLLFLQDYIKPNINVVFWSLGVEEKFYLLSPLLLPLIIGVHTRFKNTGLIALISTLIVIGTVLRTISYINAGQPSAFEPFFHSSRAPFHCCFDPLVIGIFIALIYHQSKQGQEFILNKHAGKIFYLSFAVLLAVMITTSFASYISLFDVTIQPFLISILMGGMVYGAVFHGGFAWLCSEVMAVIARLSYSLYLVHVPLWFPSYKLANAIPGANSSNMVFIPTFFITYTVVTVVCAMILHKLVEQPFLRIKDKL